VPVGDDQELLDVIDTGGIDKSCGPIGERERAPRELGYRFWIGVDGRFTQAASDFTESCL
jgi:hypothetical protein